MNNNILLTCVRNRTRRLFAGFVFAGGAALGCFSGSAQVITPGGLGVADNGSALLLLGVGLVTLFVVGRRFS